MAEIVGMIRSKFEDEGERNFAIGRRAFEHAQWQRGNFPDYTAEDFDRLMRRIREDVRAFVPIKAASIRVDDWVRCHVLRSLVAGTIGEDAAGKLSMFEYRRLTSKALTFSKKDVAGALVPGWLDFIRDVASERTRGVRVTSQAFVARVDEAARRLTGEAVGASGAHGTKPKPTAKAVARASEAVASSVADAFSTGGLGAEAVLGIVESAAKESGIPLPASIGFDPVRCTPADCDVVAGAMFQAGKYVEMVRLRDRLIKMIAAADRAIASARVAARTA